MSSVKTRADRRAQTKRLKAKRKHYFEARCYGTGVTEHDRLRRIGFVTTTPKSCNCGFCRNPRHWNGESSFSDYRRSLKGTGGE